jgi:hypothetical protein
MCCGVCVCVPFTSSLPGGIATGRQREGRVLASRRGMRSSGLVRFGGGATRADSNAPSKKRSFVFYSSIFWRFHRKVYRYKMQKKKNAPQKCAESLKTRFGFFPPPQLHTTKLAFAFAPLRLKRGVCLQKKFPRTRAAGGFVRATPRSRRAGAALPRRDKRGGKRASRGSEPSREHP